MLNTITRCLHLSTLVIIAAISGCVPASESCINSLQSFRAENESFILGLDPSPFSEEFRDGFEGLTYFEPNESYCVDASFELDEQAKTVDYPTFNGESIPYRKYGTFHFELAGKTHSLLAHQRMDLPEDQRQWLLIMFRDLTNGEETYGGGRYIEVDIPNGPETKVDFNRAANPLCALEPQLTCPVPPLENWLKVRIPVGEKEYSGYRPNDT